MILCSPEASEVLLCGEGVHKRECIPKDLYQGVQSVTKKKLEARKAHYGIDDAVDKVLDAVCDCHY